MATVGSPSARPTKRSADARAREVSRAHLGQLFAAAVAAVEPGRLIASHLSRRGDRVRLDLGGRMLVRPASRVRVLGAGKAAAAMARAVAGIVPEAPGVVIAPGADRPPARAGRVRILRGDHPVPGRASFAATRELLRTLDRWPDDATILFLLSGGASALLEAPTPGLSAADQVALHRWLLRCGAPIGVMNAMRKHASAVKGGRLALRATPREMVTLALSDVPGDALATIGSGPAVGDPSTFTEALRYLRRSPEGARLSRRLWVHFAAGAAGAIPETPKPDDPRLGRSRASVIGANATALEAAVATARALGYSVRRHRERLAGEAAVCARGLVRRLPIAPARAMCVVGGGETVVNAAGSSGRGGRCQEMALAAATEIAGSRWTILFAGTDGRDGRTGAAGAFVDGSTARRAGRLALARALADHDSHPLLHRLGDLLRSGPTGTNVMDVALAVHPGPA